jgi:hypothetical protein
MTVRRPAAGAVRQNSSLTVITEELLSFGNFSEFRRDYPTRKVLASRRFTKHLDVQAGIDVEECDEAIDRAGKAGQGGRRWLSGGGVLFCRLADGSCRRASGT